MKLADKLIALRKENGWSQEDFAEKLDVSRQAISRWENGTALPDAQNILRISKLFGVSADYLLNDEYEDTGTSPAAENAAEPAHAVPKRKHRRPIFAAAVCALVMLSVLAGIAAVKRAGAHTHPALSRVIENEAAPSCTEAGSCDEVIYCAECGEEVLRTHVTFGMPAHRFENGKCTVCGEEQRAKSE